jgi:hypothetical protein
MHSKLPFVPALILVLAPSAACLLWGFLYHAYLNRRSSKEREDLSARIPPASHHRDDLRAILLVLGVATLAFSVSASAQPIATPKIAAPKILSSLRDGGNLRNFKKKKAKPCAKVGTC